MNAPQVPPTPTLAAGAGPQADGSNPDAIPGTASAASALIDDPRGGWRFRSAAEQSLRGADAVARWTSAAAIDPYEVALPGDRERQRFGGNAQYPAHAFPHTGTQATWDDSLGVGGGPHRAEPPPPPGLPDVAATAP